MTRWWKRWRFRLGLGCGLLVSVPLVLAAFAVVGAVAAMANGYAWYDRQRVQVQAAISAVMLLVPTAAVIRCWWLGAHWAAMFCWTMALVNAYAIAGWWQDRAADERRARRLRREG